MGVGVGMGRKPGKPDDGGWPGEAPGIGNGSTGAGGLDPGTSGLDPGASGSDPGAGIGESGARVLALTTPP